MAILLSSIEQLVICQQLTGLRARYCRSVDSKDWASFENLFTPDATLDFRGSTSTSVGDGVLKGASVIVDTIRNAISDVTTVHQCFTPEFDITSADSASAIWHMVDYLRWPEGNPVRARNGYGYYHETYVRIGDAWKIQSVRLERIMIEVVPIG